MKNRLASIIIVCLLFISGLLGYFSYKSNVVSAENTIYVGVGPGNSTNSIQDAIDNFADQGDTIFVYSGIYVEHIVVDKTINLTGENMETTIIDGGGSGDVVYISANWVNVSNFKVVNGGDGIELNSVSNCKIFNCNVSNMTDLGIGLGSSTSNTIANNSVSNTYDGIILTSSDSNTIIYNQIWNNTNGVHVRFNIAWPTSADNNTITNNHISMNNGDGIYIQSSSNNTISMNDVFNNNFGMHIRESANYNFISNNNVSNSTINGMYLSKLSNNTVINNKISDNGGNGIYLFSTSNLTLIGNNLINNSYGIYLTASSKNNTLIENNVTNNDNGIHLGLASNNTIKENNVFSNNIHGIKLYSYSENNTVSSNNVASNGGIGIFLERSSNNTIITFNNVFNNLGDGIKLFNSSNNTITKNNISLNTDYGINLSSLSINNKIYHNDFNNNNNSNSPQVIDASSNGNNWDNGYPSGGNYWSDFDEPSEGAFDDYQGPDQNISGYDNIIDNGSAMGGGKNPYIIDSNSKDDYPLANPVDKFPPTIMNLFPLDGSTINESTPTISADYSDSSGINTSSVMLEVDGLHETANATITAGNITYIPSFAFEDGNHTIYIEVKDIWGNIASTSWKFVIDTTPPATINDLSLGNITNYSMTLTWTAPGDDDSTGTATGYIVKFSVAGPITDSTWDYSTTYNQSWLPLGAGNTETHIITGLNQGTQYWFAIKGYDEVPNYAYISNCPEGITLTIPTAPQNLQATSGDRYINLTWEVPSSDGDSPITMYNIYRDDKPGVYVMVPPVQFLYRDINVMNGVRYTYNVSAVNIVGEGPKSIGATAKPMTIPSAPRDLEASAGDGYVNLTWNFPISDGGSSITNYRIYRGSGPNQKTFLTEIGKILFYHDTDVTNGVTYFYIINCVNIVGESSFSNEANATPDKDSDGDGIPNYKDWDDDNDGYPDQYDDFPLNASEWLDTDDDGIGNNADPDDDDDGYDDEEDADPLDPNVWKIAEEKGDSNMIWIWFLIAVIIILCIIILILILKTKGQIFGKKVVEEEESELEKQEEIDEH